jgi:hypothetical protein
MVVICVLAGNEIRSFLVFFEGSVWLRKKAVSSFLVLGRPRLARAPPPLSAEEKDSGRE